MASDLIKRLRNPTGLTAAECVIRREAAAEIERLKKACNKEFEEHEDARHEIDRLNARIAELEGMLGESVPLLRRAIGARLGNGLIDWWHDAGQFVRRVKATLAAKEVDSE